MFPDFSWKEKRGAGVFLHISSLPSDYGIGNIGGATLRFFDFLKESGLGYWQICPLGPTGFGDSPYQSFSAFAGNPYFIDLKELVSLGLLSDSDLETLRRLPRSECDFGAIYSNIPQLLFKAYLNWKALGNSDFDFKIKFKEFCKNNAFWLDAYSLFCAFKKKFNGSSWTSWEADYKNYKKALKQKLDSNDLETVESVCFVQWIFKNQYSKFKRLAVENGIKIFGDIPIYVASDSADAWSNSELFKMGKDGTPSQLAGVAPDFFCEKGQFWGNPVYDWKGAKEQIYNFWVHRLKSAFEMFDVVRLDHFRGFADYWSIPASAVDAREGKWIKAPGVDFFKFIKSKFPTQKFVGEDLGILSKTAQKLCDDLKIPTMSVLQFAFSGDSTSPYLPHNVKRDCVYYTGTHDNDTALGWYDSASESEKDKFRTYYRTSGDSAPWDMIHSVMLSQAMLAIFPMQDVLSLPTFCRMNTPGKPDGNWRWRMTSEQLESAIYYNAPYLKRLCDLSGRTCEICKKTLKIKSSTKKC